MDSFSHYLGVARSVCARHSRFEIAAFISVLILLDGYLYAFAPPADFSPGTIVRIEQGSSAPQIAQDLAAAHIIQHPSVLRALLRFSGESNAVQTGAYKFTTPENAFVIAYRLAMGDYGLLPVRITFPEGMTIREMAAEVGSDFPGVSADEFLLAAKGQEGYLFPDTYFFQPSMDASAIVAAMHANFLTKSASLHSEINASGHSLSDIVTMASILEKEARSSTARHMVSGILWNRIARNMPLQVDAVFGYIFDRATYSPSFADLKVASPYNTYLHTGLPPGPIDNPGLDSLEAAANPTKTSYLYYLTGKDGFMHYATTYAGHQANQKKYLY
ncbi:MAG: endolytic transglycosylase MltG [Candidatus Paceibacteria bacterium]